MTYYALHTTLVPTLETTTWLAEVTEKVRVQVSTLWAGWIEKKRKAVTFLVSVTVKLTNYHTMRFYKIGELAPSELQEVERRRKNYLYIAAVSFLLGVLVDSPLRHIDIQIGSGIEQVQAEEIAPVEVVEESQPKPQQVAEAKIEAKKPVDELAKYRKLQIGSLTADQHLQKCNSTKAGKRFLEEFRMRYGEEVALIACATLNHENGHHNVTAVAPCGRGADYQCPYASANVAGVDAGLFMINTYFQAKRITKLGGEACHFADSRNPSDPCNQKKIAWLHDIENQINIIMDIYDEQGFDPWVAYKAHVKPYIN